MYYNIYYLLGILYGVQKRAYKAPRAYEIRDVSVWRFAGLLGG